MGIAKMTVAMHDSDGRPHSILTCGTLIYALFVRVSRQDSLI